MNIYKSKIAAVSLVSLIGLASCQTTLGVAGVSGGTGVAVSTVHGNTSGATFLTRNLMRVVPDTSVPGRFEVLQEAGQGGSGYWCAAGLYVMESLGMPPATRIYLDQQIGPGKLGVGHSIGFTIAPDAELQAIAAAQSNGLSMSMKRVGENWPAEHSRSQCKRNLRHGFFLF